MFFPHKVFSGKKTCGGYDGYFGHAFKWRIYKSVDRSRRRKKSSEELRQEIIQKYANCGSENISLHSIEEKLGFTLKEYNAKDGLGTESHEQDNLQNPFDKLSMDELLFLREHHDFLK